MSRLSQVIAVNDNQQEITKKDFNFAREFTKKAKLVDGSELRTVEKVLQTRVLDLSRPLDIESLQRGRKL